MLRGFLSTASRTRLGRGPGVLGMPSQALDLSADFQLGTLVFLYQMENWRGKDKPWEIVEDVSSDVRVIPTWESGRLLYPRQVRMPAILGFSTA